MLMPRVPFCVLKRTVLATLLIVTLAPLSAIAQSNHAPDLSTTYRALISESEKHKDPPAKRGYLWATLASSYHDSGNVAEAFRAYDRALPLLAKAPEARANYATALDNLGSLYLETGSIPEAEKTRTQALHLREEIGNPVDIARSQEHLAEIHLARHRFSQAETMARAAHDALLARPEPDRTDSSGTPHRGNTLLSSLVTMIFAECSLSQWETCRHSAGEADRLASQGFSSDSLERAHTDMALAFAQWKTGNPEDAEKNLQTGMGLLRAHFGDTNPAILDSMYEYRDFLVSQHRKTELRQLDQSIRVMIARKQNNSCNNCQISVFALR